MDPLGLAKGPAHGDKKDDIKRGPGGGRKHKPGKNHRNATTERKDEERFKKRAKQKKRDDLEERLMRAQEKWDKLDDFQKRMLPELDPKNVE